MSRLTVLPRRTACTRPSPVESTFSGDAFRMTMQGRTFDKRVDAGERLAEAAATLLRSTGYGQTRAARVGQLAGFDLEFEVTKEIAVEIILKVPRAYVEVRWTVADWASSEPSRIVASIERRLARPEDEHELAVTAADKARAEATRAKARLGQSFEHGPGLVDARRRQREISELLAPDVATAPEPTPRSAGVSLARA